MFFCKSILGSIFFTCLVATPILAELTLEEINSIARQTTVLIAPGLTPELVKELEENRNNPLARENNPDGVWNPGSGVIIAKINQIYYVLTVTHNFKQRDLEQNLAYGIRTSDGRVHLVKEINDGRDCPLNGDINKIAKLFRLGCYSLAVPGRVSGADLAIVSFESSQQYPLASLGDVNSVKIPEKVFVSGWPDPEKEKDLKTGQCRGKIARRQRRLAWGQVTRIIPTEQGQNGYSVFYFDLTRPGMSGGPVFDEDGFLIGIHGRGSATKGELVNKYCSVESTNIATLESEDLTKAVTEAVNYDPENLYTRFSSAQNLNNFLTLWNSANIPLPFNNKPPTKETIESGLIPLNSNDKNGSIDISIKDDLIGQFDLNDPKDVVEDIYEGFSLKNLLRDQPSSGCRFLLLGDRCK